MIHPFSLEKTYPRQLLFLPVNLFCQNLINLAECIHIVDLG